MISFSQFITEGKDAPIYHGTTFKNGLKIWVDNKLNGSGHGSLQAARDIPHLLGGEHRKIDRGICFSRMKSYSDWFVRSYRQGSSKDPVVIFEVDTRKLRHNHRVYPINYRAAYFDRETFKTGGARVQSRYPIAHHTGTQQFEEFVEGDIENFSSYVTQIDIYVHPDAEVDVTHHKIFKDPRTRIHFKGDD